MVTFLNWIGGAFASFAVGATIFLDSQRGNDAANTSFGGLVGLAVFTAAAAAWLLFKKRNNRSK